MTQAKNNWWPLLLGFGAVMLGPVVGIIVNLTKPSAEATDAEAATASAPNLGIFSLILTLATIVASIMAIRKGQRSAVVWIGLSLGILAFAYFAYIGISEVNG